MIRRRCLKTTNFNSMKVRLELRQAYEMTYDEKDFNSMKVRLEPAACWCAEASDIFQFHEGTIGTLEIGSQEYQETLFQFHEGTIGTGRSVAAVPGSSISIP